MSSIYTHCPFCEYPIVVKGHEVPFPRHCRQCGKKYVPAHSHSGDQGLARRSASNRRRPSMRQRIQHSLQNRFSK